MFNSFQIIPYYCAHSFIKKTNLNTKNRDTKSVSFPGYTY